MSFSKLLLVVLLMSIQPLLAGVSAAQMPPPNMPSLDNRELYVGALRFVEKTYGDALKSSDPNQRSLTIEALHREIGIDESDLNLVMIKSQQMRAAIYPPGGRALSLSNREQVIDARIKELSITVSGPGWVKLRAFINGPWRQATTVGSFTSTPTTVK